VAEDAVEPPVAEPDELEPDEPEPDAAGEELPEPPSFLVVVSVLASLFTSDLASVFVSPPDEPFGFVEEYRSAYQPPPLRMKFPPLICRFAVAFAHEGQISTGASVIF
jgi:hypothetical protein